MPKVGDEIAGYVLSRQLGRGGQGMVFAAIKKSIANSLTSLGNPIIDIWDTDPEVIRALAGEKPECAFKFIDRPDMKALPRAREEVASVKELNDTHIIKVFDYDLNEKPSRTGSPWIRMEYIEGGNLKEQADAGKWKLDIAGSLKVIKEICGAVGLAHSLKKPVIHRDLKPENILLRKNGQPVVCDFGISIILDDERVNLTTESEVGSRNYIAPELRGLPPEGRPSPASDIYSLGKVLYYMLSGGKVRDGEDHDREPHDLRRWPESTRQMEYVYDKIFKSTICSYDQRLKSITELLTEIDQVIALVSEHFYPAEEGRKCIICGQGKYREKKGRVNADFVSTEGSISGWRQSMDSQRLWVCDMCGNIQWFTDFRP